jgi:hypothetical protein
MSIAEFSSALKNKAITEWFKKEAAQGGSASKEARQKYSAANINTLINATSDYRSAEQTAEKTAFVITKDTIRNLLVDFKGIPAGSEELEATTDAYFNKFRLKNSGIKVNRRRINIGNLPAVYFSNISFDSITNLVNNILELKPSELASLYEKGHVVGLNTELLRVTANRISNIDARGYVGASSAKNLILKELDNVIEYYKKLDYDSANIKPAEDVAIYASVNKSINKSGKTKYLVEIQPKASNQASAQEVKATIGSIRKLFSPNNLTNDALKGIIDKLLVSVTDPKFSRDLVNLKSSPSYIDMMGILIASTIEGKPVNQKFNVPTTKIATKAVPKVNLSELRKVVKEELNKVQDLKNKLNTKKPTRSLPTASTTNLEALIRSRLELQIKKNMGTGNAKNVLNYQTGRFAKSATIERVSISREGMVSVFYNYMRNPYGTFSEGGKQQLPKSRDPKTLISKSIREIGVELVGNRMRAILV